MTTEQIEALSKRIVEGIFGERMAKMDEATAVFVAGEIKDELAKSTDGISLECLAGMIANQKGRIQEQECSITSLQAALKGERECNSRLRVKIDAVKRANDLVSLRYYRPSPFIEIKNDVVTFRDTESILECSATPEQWIAIWKERDELLAGIRKLARSVNI